MYANIRVPPRARCSSKTNELRDIESIGCRARNIAIWKIYNFQNKITTTLVPKHIMTSQSDSPCLIECTAISCSEMPNVLDKLQRRPYYL